MTLKKRILTGMGALAFMALLALNVSLVNTGEKNQNVSDYTLIKLSAQASISGESVCCQGHNGACVTIFDENGNIISVTAGTPIQCP